ncbi:MAG: hypothetical protein IJ973_03875, partial [Christensenellaceae bacterium]|nr:hypothetical protein [Christensenellaceae bacterium]
DTLVEAARDLRIHLTDPAVRVSNAVTRSLNTRPSAQKAIRKAVATHPIPLKSVFPLKKMLSAVISR